MNLTLKERNEIPDDNNDLYYLLDITVLGESGKSESEALARIIRKPMGVLHDDFDIRFFESDDFFNKSTINYPLEKRHILLVVTDRRESDPRLFDLIKKYQYEHIFVFTNSDCSISVKIQDRKIKTIISKEQNLVNLARYAYSFLIPPSTKTMVCVDWQDVFSIFSDSNHLSHRRIVARSYTDRISKLSHLLPFEKSDHINSIYIVDNADLNYSLADFGDLCDVIESSCEDGCQICVSTFIAYPEESKVLVTDIFYTLNTIQHQ
jgi:hypothetical protein